MIERLSSALGRIAPSATLAMTNRVLAMKAEGKAGNRAFRWRTRF